jgi:ethanolamine permease
LGALHLWGLAVGLVISGEYFGWSYGWGQAGTLGFCVTTLLVAIFYVSFVFTFAELSASIPEAGGPFAYARRAFGPTAGFVAGWSSLIEFVFAPPAIALSIGAYLNVQFPGLPTGWAAAICFVSLMALNARGIQTAATFELCVTVLAVVELCVFMALLLPHFSWDDFSRHGWAGENEFTFGAVGGIAGAIPFAIWFFLAIEGAALAAEEARDPQRSIAKAFSWAIATLVVLAFGVMLAAGGVGDWKALESRNDPLPEAMKAVVGTASGWLHMLVWIGLFGLVASLHGIILGYSRQIFAMARAGYLPGGLGHLHPRRATPDRAMLAGGAVGLGAIAIDAAWPSAVGLTATLVTLSALGALTLYVVSAASWFRLRRSEPELERPFRTPLAPGLPILALILGLSFLVVSVVTQPMASLAFFALLAVSLLVFEWRRRAGVAKE